MCDVLPAIGEETPPSSPDDGGDNSKLEQLMISMLEERDKLMEKLRESQDSYTEATKKLGDVEGDNKVLLRQLQALMPQVGTLYIKKTRIYSLKYSRIKYFVVWLNSAQKQSFTDKIFVVECESCTYMYIVVYTKTFTGYRLHQEYTLGYMYSFYYSRGMSTCVCTIT